MLRPRVIPVLLLRSESLVKTVQFGRFAYIGDPTNTVRIFNELEVDELAFLDIGASVGRREPNTALLADIANECFMPLSYGGGIRTVDQARTILGIGYEKVVINSFATENPAFVTALADRFGSQAVVASIDVKQDRDGRSAVHAYSGRLRTGMDPVEWAVELEGRGAGEILLTSIDREGTWNGYDTDLIRAVTDAVTIPVVAHGGAGSLDDVRKAIHVGGASAAAVGSMVVFQRKGMGVLVNFPATDELTFPVAETRTA